MESKTSKEMKEFIDKIDLLCWEYGYEIWPTDEINAKNTDGTYPTLTIHGKNGEKATLIYIDGDGGGE